MAEQVMRGRVAPPIHSGSAAVRRKAASAVTPIKAPIDHEVIRSPGQPLDPDTRTFMESCFGEDFSEVRVHTDLNATRSAFSVNARAYTIGNHIVLGTGHYSPSKKLIAHELTHVIQQQEGRISLMRQKIPGEEPDSLKLSMDPSQMTDAALDREIIVLQRWLDRQTTGSEETDRLFRVLSEMKSEKDRRSFRSASGGSGSVTSLPVSSSAMLRLPRQTRSASVTTPDVPTRTLVDPQQTIRRLPAISVEEQFQFLFNQIGFINAPPGAPIVDPSGRGANVGPARAPGYQVYAAIQVVDPQGRQVFMGSGAYLGGGGLHGEEQALRDLRNHLPRDGSLRGGRLITTVTQDPCGPDRHNCAFKISALAEEFGLLEETYVPERDPVRPGGQPVRPPTATRGSQRTDRPAIRYRSLGQQTDSGSSSRKGEELRAEIGTPDMRGLAVGGPSPRGEAIGAGITLAFMGANFVLNLINDHIQEKRAREALSRIEPGLRAQRQQHPDLGILLVFYYSQYQAPEESLMRPGAVFGHVEFHTGRTQDEARQNWTAAPAIRQGFGPQIEASTQQVWIPPIVAPGVSAIRTPFPSIALGTFAEGRAILQDVEWGGITGFDDEDTSSLRLTPGQNPRFLILQVPPIVRFFNDGIRYDVNVPVEQRPTKLGAVVPVVNLDPVVPFSNVSAACIFPVDDATDEIFSSAKPTYDNRNQLGIYVNFGKVRWARPENIIIPSRI